MRRIITLFLLSAGIALMSFVLQQKKRVVFFGDSITAAGVRPGGYIVKVGELAANDKLADGYEFIGAGIGGNKVYDLFLRLEDDVLSKDPDVVVIFVGVNDVWHKRSYGTGTDADKFEKFYAALIDRMTARQIKVILCTPAAIGERTDFSNELDGDLNHYSNMIRSLAEKNSLPLIDLRKVFLQYNLTHNKENKESGILTTDRVHLNERGNELVAEQMWKTIKSL
jgi:lysophospholipase L1-like esterase